MFTVETLELTQYLNKGSKKIIKRVLSGSLLNIKEILFLSRAKRALDKSGHKRLESEKNGLHIPAFLISSITQNCNLFCKGCYARVNSENKKCGEHPAKTLLTAEEWSVIFDEAEDLGISFNLLAGGEPLLRKDVLLVAARKKDTIFPVFTNGTLIDKEYQELFDKHRNLIPIVSIEGNERATDDRRGKGTYSRLTDAFKLLKKKRMLYGISVTVTKENINEVTSEEFIDSISSYGCKIVFFIEYVPIDHASEHIAPDENARRLLEQSQERLQNKYNNILFLSFPGDEKYMGGCLAAGRGFFHINSDGAAEACPFSPYSDCNVKNGGLKTALASSLFEKIKEINLANTEHIGGCALFEKEDVVKELVSDL